MYVRVRCVLCVVCVVCACVRCVCYYWCLLFVVKRVVFIVCCSLVDVRCSLCVVCRLVLGVWVLGHL